ncbi:MAG: hypothetical protein AMXMBFR58_29380 [Phycisphaerae bacterium]
MRLTGLVVVETWEGLEVVAPGTCGACQWHGWSQWDVGLVKVGEREYDHEESPECVCPNCGLREVAVDLHAEFPAREMAGARRKATPSPDLPA